MDAYVDSAPTFAQPLLKKIRKAFHTGCPEVVEAIKWGKPHFDHHGMLGGMASFKAHVTMGLWRGRELTKRPACFEPMGETQAASAKFEGPRDLPTQKALTELVRRAAKLNESGKPKKRAAAKKKPALRAPKDLTEALRGNAKAKAFFASLAPSRKRDYIEWITEAKRPATRTKRLATTLEWLAEGKTRHWKYERS